MVKLCKKECSIKKNIKEVANYFHSCTIEGNFITIRACSLHVISEFIYIAIKLDVSMEFLYL